MNAVPSPEILPALDETRPQIGPNLASDPDFCKLVAEHCYRNYAYPYMLMQQRLWPIWQMMDDAWRVKMRTGALDISITDPSLLPKNADAKGKDGGMISNVDGYSAKVQPAAVFKQIKTKTDMHMSIAYADGLPVRAVKPETMYEHPLYNPTQQQVDTQNELIRQCAREVNLEVIDRKGRGCWSKYGFMFAAVDFQHQLEDAPMAYRFPQDPREAQMMLQMLSQRYGQPPKIEVRGQAQFAVWYQTVIKTMKTDFMPLRHDDVFIDLTLSGGIQRQPCPCVRQHGTRYDLLGNDYDPEKNPFGWLNVQQAYTDQTNQYTLSAQDELNLQQELLKKWNQSSQGLIPQKEALKQRWTCYPMLSIVQGKDGKLMLDGGEGVTCPTCDGRMTVDAPEDPMTGEGVMPVTCPQCQGLGKIFGKPERYVVQFWGLLMYGGSVGRDSGCTVLRIQRNPDPNDKIPLIFGAHLIEDDAGAIPMSVVEASISAWIQLATAHNQYLDFKNRVINPPWHVPMDSPNMNRDMNRVNSNIPYLDRPDENRPVELGAIDASNNLISYIQLAENQIQEIIGMTDTLLGIVSSGRRPATEIQTAFDAAKLPITVEIDSYNRQVLEPWAQFHLDNVQAWSDRDWIRKRTGREDLGRIQLFSAVADEFMKKMGLIQNTRYVLEASVNDPSINRAALWESLLRLTGMPNVESIVNDNGMRKSQMEAAMIVGKICGQGIFLPPDPSDPDELFIAYFEQALKDPHWQESTPETLPLLQQRLMMQQMQLQQKQQAMLMQQMQQQALLGPPQGPGAKGGNGNQPKTPGKTAENKTQAGQQMAGAQQG